MSVDEEGIRLANQEAEAYNKILWGAGILMDLAVHSRHRAEKAEADYVSVLEITDANIRTMAKEREWAIDREKEKTAVEFHRANTNEERLIIALEEDKRLRGAVREYQQEERASLDFSGDTKTLMGINARDKLFKAVLEPPGGKQ